MNDNAVQKAIEAKGIDLKECRFSFSAVTSATGVPDTEVEFNKIEWFDHASPPVTWAEVITAGSALDVEYDTQEYARNRRDAYPDWQAQLNKIYDDGIDKWKSEMVDPIKVKYPKG